MHAVDVIRAAIALIRGHLASHPEHVAGNDLGVLGRVASDIELLSPLTHVAAPELAPVLDVLPVVVQVVQAVDEAIQD